MAITYVEEAILRVRDRASPEIRNVRKELRRLYDEAERLNRSRGFRLSMEGVEQAMREVRELRAETRRLTQGRNLIRFDVSGNARQELANLSRLVREAGRNQSIRFNVSQTGTQLRTLQRNLDRLRAEGPLALSVTAPGLPGVVADMRELNRLLSQIRQRSSISINTRSSGMGVPVPGFAGGGEDARSWGAQIVEGMRSGFGDGRWFGQRIAAGFAASIGGELYGIGRDVARVGATAPLTMETAEQNLRVMGLDEAEIDFITNRANAMSTGEFSQVPAAAIVMAAPEALGSIPGSILDPRNAEVVGATLDRIAESYTVFRSRGMSESEAMTQARLVEKSVSLLGAINNPELADQLQDAILDLFITSGGDFGALENVNMLQQAGAALQAMLTPETLRQMGLLRDEGGRQSTSDFRMMVQDMIRGNINEEDEAAQVRMGFRNADGTANTEVITRMMADPLAFVEEVVMPMARAAGVDPADAVAMTSFVDEALGFTTTGSRMFALMSAQMEEMRNERRKQDDVTFTPLMEAPTTTQRAQALRSQFQNTVGNMLLPVLENVVNPALGFATEALQAAQRTPSMADDAVALGAAVAPLGMAAMLEALSAGNVETAASLLAAQNLNSAAENLNSAAALLAAGASPEARARRRAQQRNQNRLGTLRGMGAASGMLALNAMLGDQIDGAVEISAQDRIDIQNLTVEDAAEFERIRTGFSPNDNEGRVQAMESALDFLASLATSGASATPNMLNDALAEMSSAQVDLAAALRDAEAPGMSPARQAVVEDNLAEAERRFVASQGALAEVIQQLPMETLASMAQTGQLDLEDLSGVMSSLPGEIAAALNGLRIEAEASPAQGAGPQPMATGPRIEATEAEVQVQQAEFGDWGALAQGLRDDLDLAPLFAGLEEAGASQSVAAMAMAEGTNGLNSAGDNLTGAASALMTAAERLASIEVNVTGNAPSTRTPAPRLDTGTTGPQ